MRCTRLFLRAFLTVACCALMLRVAYYTQPSFAAPGIYQTIHFQGKVANADGTNVSNGSYTFSFSVYDAPTGGTALWTESRSGGNQVTVTDGVFHVALGSVTAFGSAVDFNTDALYLGISFAGDSEMTPRIRLTAVPYALNAAKVSGLTVTNTTGTLTIPNETTIEFSGANNLTFTTTSTTNITLPSTGTLATLAGTETLTNKSIGTSGLTFVGSSVDITTGTNEDLVLMPNGTGRIGLGISGPTSFVDFAGSTASNASLRIHAGTAPSSPNAGDVYSDGSSLFFYDGTGASWVDLAGAASVWSESGSDIFYTTGNVGIGTSAPAGIFAVEYSAATPPRFSLTNNLSTTPVSFLNFRFNTNTTLGNLAGLSVDGTNSLYLYSAATRGLGLGTNSSLTPNLYITPAGNVGISSTNPGTNLEVGGTAWLRGSSSGTSGLYVSSAGRVGMGTTNPLGMFTITTTGSTGVPGFTPNLFIADQDNPRILLEDLNNGVMEIAQNAATSLLGFESTFQIKSGINFTNGVVGSGTTRVTFLSTGNVGIGTTAPAALLDLAASTTDRASLRLQSGTAPTTPSAGDVYSDGTNIYYYDGTGTAWIDLTDGGGSSVWSLNGTAAYFSTGNVGIGTTAPTSLLDVNAHFTVASSHITSAQPHAFTAVGDVAVSNNIVLTNQTAATLRSDGPLTIQSGEAFENLDLVLDPSGSGSVLVADGNNLQLYSGQQLVFDVDDASDSYFSHDSTNDRIRVYVDGDERFRFDTGGNESDGSISTTAFDLAETYPTSDASLEPGDVVSFRISADTGSYEVVKSSAQHEALAGVVSARPGLILGGGGFQKEFCERVQRSDQAALQEREQLIAEERVSRNLPDDTELPAAVLVAIDDRIAQCAAPAEVPIALVGRVPVKVDHELGKIEAGDFLAPSTVHPGTVTQARSEGWIIGRALEASSEKDTVMAYIFHSWYEPHPSLSNSNLAFTRNEQTKLNQWLALAGTQELLRNSLSEHFQKNKGQIGTITIAQNTLHTPGVLELQNHPGAGRIELFGKKIVLTTSGGAMFSDTVATPHLKTNRLTIMKGQEPTIGEGVIQSGARSTTISHNRVSTSTKIFLTPTARTANQALTVQKSAGIFTVSVDRSLPWDITFDYWIVETAP